MLPLEEEPLQHKRADPARLDRLEDELERDPVGEVSDDGAARRERPRQLEEEPQQHLEDAEHAAEAEARVDEEGELLGAAPLEEVDEEPLLAHHAAHDDLAQVDDRLDVLLHVARQPGDEAVAQREQLLRRLGRQPAQPRAPDAHHRAARAARGQHLADDLLGDPVDARRHQLGHLGRLEPPEDLGHRDELARHDVRQPARHHPRLARHDALPADPAERLAGPRLEPEPAKLDGVEDHVDRHLVGEPADAAREERDGQVAQPVVAEAPVRCHQHDRRRLASFAGAEQAPRGHERPDEAHQLQRERRHAEPAQHHVRRAAAAAEYGRLLRARQLGVGGRQALPRRLR